MNNHDYRSNIFFFISYSKIRDTYTIKYSVFIYCFVLATLYYRNQINSRQPGGKTELCCNINQNSCQENNSFSRPVNYLLHTEIQSIGHCLHSTSYTACALPLSTNGKLTLQNTDIIVTGTDGFINSSVQTEFLHITCEIV